MSNHFFFFFCGVIHMPRGLITRGSPSFSLSLPQRSTECSVSPSREIILSRSSMLCYGVCICAHFPRWPTCKTALTKNKETDQREKKIIFVLILQQDIDIQYFVVFDWCESSTKASVHPVGRRYHDIVLFHSYKGRCFIEWLLKAMK